MGMGVAGAAPAGTPRVREAQQKPGAGAPAYTRWVNRPLGRGIAHVAVPAGLTPNAVTAISAAFSLIAIAVIICVDPSVWSAALIAVLLAAGYAFDSADGQVARRRGLGGPAGEWVDHVVDAFRMPAIHLAVLFALTRQPGDIRDYVWIVVPLFCLVTVTQFMSQILAEQLSRHAGQVVVDEGASNLRSILLLPMDTGVLCWSFVLWAWTWPFLVAYSSLLVVNVGYMLVSMRRKYARLRLLDR